MAADVPLSITPFLEALLLHYIFPTADFDYVTTAIMLTFMPSDEEMQMMCFNISIIDDSLGNEPDEEFSVTISDAVPAGSVGDVEACVTIIDNDSKSNQNV